MWHSLYTLNYDMITDAAGNPSGPTGTGVGPYGQTLPSVGNWLPSNDDTTRG